MIHLFKGTRRVLFFPKSWANSVTNWLLGVRSSDGSIVIKNTATPGEDGSVDLRVNKSFIAKQIKDVAESRSLTDAQIERVKEIVHGLVDGISVKWQDKVFSVDADWIVKLVKKNLVESGDDGESKPDVDTYLHHSIYKPDGTSHYYGNKVHVKITKGVVTLWDDLGVYDIFTGNPA